MAAIHKIYDVNECTLLHKQSNNVPDVPFAGVAVKELKDSGVTVLNWTMHFFPNGGETGCILLAESHFNYHWWPEKRFMAMDF